MSQRDPDVTQLPIVIAVVALIWALVPVNPYGYYVLLRWVCCPILAYLAWVAFSTGKSNWGWFFGLGALIYNPISRVGLSRELWSLINIASVVALLGFMYRQRRDIALSCDKKPPSR